jgi:hypothetical protein
MFHHSYPLDLHRFCFWTIIGCVVSPALQSGCYQRKGGMVMYHMKYGLTPVTDAITKSKESNYLKESRASRQFWLNGGDSPQERDHFTWKTYDSSPWTTKL